MTNAEKIKNVREYIDKILDDIKYNKREYDLTTVLLTVGFMLRDE